MRGGYAVKEGVCYSVSLCTLNPNPAVEGEGEGDGEGVSYSVSLCTLNPEPTRHLRSLDRPRWVSKNTTDVFAVLSLQSLVADQFSSIFFGASH